MNAGAIEGAVQIARGFGLDVREAVALRSTNNLVIWLRPAPVVAKIGIGRNAMLPVELAVAREVSALGGPIVAPAPEIPAILHSSNGFDVTFWHYCPQSPSVDIAPGRIAPALRSLHATLARITPDLKSQLPSYLQEIERARAVVDSAPVVSALPASDRRLLADTIERLMNSLKVRSHPAAHAVIHGSPHSYNVLLEAGRPLFIDFETTCVGPIEWDVAFLEEGAEEHYADRLDRELLWSCRAMASAMTAALCWSEVERGDLREHAEAHLENVRQRITPNI
jgi:hypothetical protein